MSIGVAVALTAALQLALFVVVASRRGSQRGNGGDGAGDMVEYHVPADADVPAASERRALFGSPGHSGSDVSDR